jgi:hypothetical protein
MDVRDRSLAGLGGAAAIGVGLLVAVSSVLYVILPADLQASVPGPRFLPALAKDGTLLMGVFWTQAVIGILGLAVVPAVTEAVADVHIGWARWTSTLATVGFAVSSVGYLLSIERLPRIAAAYVAGDPATQAALAVTWKASIDLFGVWGYGAVGAWILAVSLLAIRGERLSRPVNLLGILAGIAYLLLPVGAIVKIPALYTVSAVAGVVIAAAWYILVGLRIRAR